MQVTLTHLLLIAALIMLGFLTRDVCDLLRELARYKNAQAMSIFKHAGLLRSETEEVDE